MVAIAFWHFTVFVPDRFWGGLVGAFVAAVAGGLAAGYLLPSPGLASGNPPGAEEAIFAAIGAIVALAASYGYGARLSQTQPSDDPHALAGDAAPASRSKTPPPARERSPITDRGR